MSASLIVLLLLVAGAEVAAYFHDPALPLRGLQSSVRLVGTVWKEIALGFVLAGLVEVALPRSLLVEWLGRASETRGILVGWLVGLFLPGGPYLVFPVVAGLLRSGAGAGALIALVTAKFLVGPIRMVAYEAPLVGWTFALARLLPAFLLPPLLGVVGQWVYDLLSRPQSAA